MVERSRRKLLTFESLETRQLLAAHCVTTTESSTTDFVACGQTHVRSQDTYELSLENFSGFPLRIDWGDGRVDSFDVAPELALHSYREVGMHTITLEALSSESQATEVLQLDLTVDAAAPMVEDASDVGLWAELFTNVDPLQNSLPAGTADITGIDPTLNFDFGLGGPASGLSLPSKPDLTWGGRWSGTVTPSVSANYDFHVLTGSSDAVRIWVDGNLLVDTWSSPTSVEQTGSLALTANEAVSLLVEYRAGEDSSKLQVRWEHPESLDAIIPSDQLFPSSQMLTSGALFESWENLSESSLDGLINSEGYLANTPDFAQVISTVEWLEVSDRNQGARVRGLLSPPESGYYTFHVASSSPAELRLSQGASAQNANLIASVDQATDFRDFSVSAGQHSLPIYLDSSLDYYIELLQAAQPGELQSHASVGWTRPGTETMEIIPSDLLQPVRPVVTLFADVSVTNEEAGFAQGAQFTVRRSDDLGRDLRVAYTLGGTAENGVDYQPLTGEVFIPQGSQTATIHIDPIDEGVLEGLETVVLRLAATDRYWLAAESERQATATIQGEDVGGTSLLPEAAVDPANVSFLFGRDNGAAQFTAVSVSDPAVTFDEALQIEVESFVNPYDVRPVWILDAPFAKGDQFVFQGFLRSVDGSPVVAQAVIEPSTTDFSLGVTTTIQAGSQWQPFSLTFESPIDIPPQQLRIDVRFGFQQQAVQLGGVEFIQLSASGTRSLLPEEALLNPSVETGDARYSLVDVNDASLPFDTGLRVEVNSYVNPFDVRPIWRLEESLTAGSTVIGRGYIRSDHGDSSATVEARIEQNTAPYQGESFFLNATDVWQPFEFTFVAPIDFEAQEYRFDLRLGFGDQQIVEIADLELLVPDYHLDDLPGPKNSFDDREADAEWRNQAQIELDQHRKDLLRVQVEDSAGNQLEEATITVQQVNSALKLGSTIAGEWFSESAGVRYDTDEAARYRAITADLFERSVDTSSAQWIEWLRNPTAAIEDAEWSIANGLQYKGHSIVWGNLSEFPAPTADVGLDLAGEYDQILATQGATAAEAWLEQTILDHILNNTAAGLSGTIPGTDLPIVSEWDVINHPLQSTEIWNIVGDDFMFDVIQAARATVHPSTELFLNENSILTGTDPDLPEAFFDLAESLLLGGAEINGIGLQSHFVSDSLPPITQIQSELARFDSLDLSVHISEFDVDSNAIDLQTQADFTRDFLLAALSDPAVDAFYFWGFWSHHHWRSFEDAELVTRDFQVLPNGQVLLDYQAELLQPVSRSGATTDFDLLHGTYEIVVTYPDGSSQSTIADINSGSASVTLTKPNSAPTASAGGPYSVAEGALLKLDGSGSSDAEELGSALTYEWDLDYDGTNFEVDITGAEPELAFTDDFSARTIALRVTDAASASDIETTTLEVTNADPVARDDLGSNLVTSAETALRIDNVLANDSDPAGENDPLTVTHVEANAVEINQPVALASGALVIYTGEGSFSYDPNGAFTRLLEGETSTDTFSYRIADGDGGTASAQVTVEITGIGNPSSVELAIADQSADRLFTYEADVTSISDFFIDTAAAIRGVTSNASSGKYWLLDDQGGAARVYDTSSNQLLGSWQFRAEDGSRIRSAEGIATDGSSIWIVSRLTDRIYRFDNGSTETEGTIHAESSFALDSSNATPYGLETDGNSLWVVNDSTNLWKTFTYTLDGTLLGSWDLDPANRNARGITIDPANPTDLLVINDGSRDELHRYTGATQINSGSLSASATYQLASENNNPSGIAYLTIGDPGIGPVSDIDPVANIVDIELLAAGLPVGIVVQAIDPDSEVSYQLVDDAEGRFQIDIATGQITIADATPGLWVVGIAQELTVLATSDDGSESTETFTVDVVGPVVSVGTQWLVIDDQVDAVLSYDVDLQFETNTALAAGNSSTRGIATTPDGSKYFVVDSDRNVYVYDANDNSLLGSWTMSGVIAPEGITTDGTDLWVVSNHDDRVYRFVGGVDHTAGVVVPDASFALEDSNSVARGLTTDGSHFWVVNDAGNQWKTFKYDLRGNFLGSWNLDRGNRNARGITIDPENPTDLLVVNSAFSDQVYRYVGATEVLSGDLSADEVILLDPTNNRPEGIASLALTSPALTSFDFAGIDFAGAICRSIRSGSAVDLWAVDV